MSDIEKNEIPQNTHERGAYKQEKKALFLQQFRQLGLINRAAESTGISREVVYQWRKNDPNFLREFEEANNDVTDILEETAFSRAVEKSDALLMFLLKARKPVKYRQDIQKIEYLNAAPGFSPYNLENCSDDELLKLAKSREALDNF